MEVLSIGDGIMKTYLEINRQKIDSEFSTKSDPIYNELYDIEFICKQCEKRFIDSGFNYCPYCGSKIVGKENK